MSIAPAFLCCPRRELVTESLPYRRRDKCGICRIEHQFVCDCRHSFPFSGADVLIGSVRVKCMEVRKAEKQIFARARESLVLLDFGYDGWAKEGGCIFQ
jgi:hypothetical protein